MKKWLRCFLAIALIALFAVMAVASGSSNSGSSNSSSNNTSNESKTTDQPNVDQPTETKEHATEKPTEVPKKDVYVVGDTLEENGLRIVYVASGVFKSTNSYIQPDDGKEYIFLKFYVENIGSSDQSISYFDFDCYADGYSCDSFYSIDEPLSATLSPGRTTMGNVGFEVPKDANEIEVEYEINLWTDKKVKFAYEGDKDSGFVPENNSSATEDAYKPGDVAETSNLKITYISAEESQSDNMFIQPKEGYHYITLTFEFENTSSADVLVSEFSFDCYADGAACDSVYFRDDDLGSVTLSAGRKAQGTVTFEVPKSAEVVEVEYDEISLFGKRIVFSYV